MAWPPGLGRIILESTGSTNERALALAADHPHGAWFLAHEQTAGRGRRARPWVSPRGNFHASLLIHPMAPPQAVALYSFAAALGLRDALADLCQGAEIALKWPNDVLLNGGKVAGILLESASAGGLVRDLAIGVGVNLIAHPDAALIEAGAVPPVSLLAETGRRLAPEAFLDALAPRLDHWGARLRAGGFAPLREAFLASATRLGQTIRARTGQASHEGVFETIDLQGNLILRTAGGPLAIPAADIFF